jgi:hypothetical protein
MALAISSPVFAQSQSSSDSQPAVRVEALATALHAFEARLSPGDLELDAAALAHKLTADPDATCTTYTLPYAGSSGGSDIWGVVDRFIPSVNSCYLSDDEPWDFWSVPVKAGDRITFAVETTVRTYFSVDSGNVYFGSTALQPNGKYIGGYVWQVPSSFTNTTVKVSISPYATSTTYTLAVGKPVASGTCAATTSTACVLNNRFQVKVRYRSGFDNNPADTDAQVKPVTGFATTSFETAFFYFNSSSNIEMMLKILDQGNTNGAGQPTIAVLFGSATPLRTELTVTDTLKGTSKTYVSAFNSMQGATDFTAFVK